MSISPQSIIKLAMLGLFSLFVACAASEIKPVELHAEDMCAYCKMAISERQYAAEFVTLDGETRKFDDIGCLLNYVKEQKPQGATFFVNDYNTKQWLRANSAYFVRSSEINSPMSGGIIAFQNQADAERAATKFKGTQARFADLVK